jgi:acyl-CoA synthetase (AMP-forming)/AMP-acid ligase II
MFAAFLGAMLIGAVPSFMPCPSSKQDPDLYWQNHRTLLERTSPRLILTDAQNAMQMAKNQLGDEASTRILCLDEAKRPLLSSDIIFPAACDTALLQHSSGTTGLKKGVMLSYAAVDQQIRAYSRTLSATRQDVIVSWLPVYHDMGLVACTLLPLTLGLTVVVLDPFEWSSNPVNLFRVITTHNGSLTWLPNFAFEHFVRSVDENDDTYDLSSVRAFINCSEPCKPSTFGRFAARFASRGVTANQLQVCYAMAETVFAVTQTRIGQPVKIISVSEQALREEKTARPPRADEATISFLSTGNFIDGMRVRIDGMEGNGSPEGTVGEVVISGECLFDGYYGLPDVTRERLIGKEYHSRDLGFVLDGELYILGRMDDVIIVHGKNFCAHEVELALNKIRGIKPGRAVAFGVENDAVGSLDLVVVAEHTGDALNLPEIKRHIKDSVFQEIGITIREAMLVGEGWLVKTTSGKISRESNKAKYLSEKSRQGTLC